MLQEWADRVYREGMGIGAAFNECCRLGAAPARARDMAWDAVQHAMMQASKISDLQNKFNDFEHFCNWVYRVAINYVRDVFRRRSRERRLPDDQADQPQVVDPPQVQLTREFLEQLTPQERDLLESFEEDGPTLDEFAARWLPPDGRSENARRLEIWRKRREVVARLRRWLLDNGCPPGDSP
jgi:hypothetical protein